MRKIVNNMLIIMLLFICSILFVSCEAITAQNITNTSSTPGMNGGGGKNGNPWMNGGQGRTGNPGNNGAPAKNGNK